MAASSPAAPLKVLVVDDDPLLLPALGRMVRALGYDPVTAHHAEEAMALIMEQRYDVVISDYLMPGMNGVELLAWVAEQNPSSTRILMSGVREQATADASGSAAVSGFVGKPIDPQALASIIALAAERAKLVSSLPPASRAAPAASRDPIERLAGGVAAELWASLGVLTRGLDAAASSVSRDDPAREEVLTALAAVDRMRGTLQRLTTIGGRRAAARETLDLNDWLRDLPPRLRAALGNGALLVTARCAETCPVRLDIALLDELVLGLAARAREVAPRGQVTVESWRRSGEVGLDVSDEGPTQTEGQLAAMFQPYGLITDDGLRLAACQGLARTLGGRLEVKNRAGGGVTFTLVVPAL